MKTRAISREAFVFILKVGDSGVSLNADKWSASERLTI